MYRGSYSRGRAVGLVLVRVACPDRTSLSRRVNPVLVLEVMAFNSAVVAVNGRLVKVSASNEM